MTQTRRTVTLKRTPLARTQMPKPKRGFWTCQRKQQGVKCGRAVSV